MLIPIADHAALRFSKSMMLVAPRYNTGFFVPSWVAIISSVIGDFFCLPAANQLSASAIHMALSV